MKKHTSRSASANRKTSSPSDTSGRTGGTESPNPDGTEVTGPFAALLKFAEEMSPAKKKAVLISAGILTPDGQLAPHYLPKKAAKKKPVTKKKPAKKVRV